MNSALPRQARPPRRRLDPKYAPLLVPAIMAIAMSLVMSLVQTIARLGFTPNLASAWLTSFATGVAVAIPMAILVAPRVQRLARHLTGAPVRPPRAAAEPEGTSPAVCLASLTLAAGAPTEHRQADLPMTATAGKDFFTLIHTRDSGESCPRSPPARGRSTGRSQAAAGFGATWAQLSRMLKIHGKHEDKHFFPLIADRARQVMAGVNATHGEMDEALAAKLTGMIEAAVAAPAQLAGLAVYRELSGFTASCLLHLLEEDRRDPRDLAPLHRRRTRRRPRRIAGQPVTSRRGPQPQNDAPGHLPGPTAPR